MLPIAVYASRTSERAFTAVAARGKPIAYRWFSFCRARTAPVEKRQQTRSRSGWVGVGFAVMLVTISRTLMNPVTRGRPSDAAIRSASCFAPRTSNLSLGPRSDRRHS